MNILFTSDLSGMGGGETSLLNLCKCLSVSNKIVVLCKKEGTLPRLLKAAGIKVYVLNYRDKVAILKNIILIRNIIADERIDVIHSNDYITSLFFYFLSIGKNCNNFWTCHGQWYKFAPIIKFFIKKSNKTIFCVSSAVENNLNSMGISNTVKSFLGIPINEYRTAMHSDLRKKLYIDNDTVLLALIGRYQSIKGQLKLAEAIRLLSANNINIKCLLIGGCVFNTPDEAIYYNQVQMFIKEHSLENIIHIIGERRDIPQILHDIDALVIASDNESFGMVAIEALAAGTVILSTPNDGVSEILSFNKKFLAETNDSAGLAKLINQFITDIDEYKYMFKQYADDMVYKYDIESIADTYLHYFK